MHHPPHRLQNHRANQVSCHHRRRLLFPLSLALQGSRSMARTAGPAPLVGIAISQCHLGPEIAPSALRAGTARQAAKRVALHAHRANSRAQIAFFARTARRASTLLTKHHAKLAQAVATLPRPLSTNALSAQAAPLPAASQVVPRRAHLATRDGGAALILSTAQPVLRGAHLLWGQ